jgi:hypothetical protein
MTLSDAVHRHLQTAGPCTLDELHAAMLEQGATKAKTPVGVRLALGGYGAVAEELPDGRWDLVTRRLDGAVLTVRPRSRLEDGVLWAHGDLSPLQRVPGPAPPLATGGEARWSRTGIPRLSFPPGALPPLERDDLLALSWDGQALHVSLVSLPSDDAYADRVDRARRLLALHATKGESYRVTSLTDHVLSALREDPELLAEPLPPLSELLPLPADGEAPGWRGTGLHLELQLPARVVDELHRRARLLGDATTSYAAMLLAAAVDRVRDPEPTLPRSTCSCGNPYCRYHQGDDDRDDWLDVDTEERWEWPPPTRLDARRR